MKTLFVACSLSALCLLGCHDSFAKDGGDSNSNWLKACDGQAECGGDLICACGVCTAPCTDDSACGRNDTAAVCAATPELGCSVDRARVCLASCQRSSECASSLTCNDEVCGRFERELPSDGGAPEPLDAMAAEDAATERDGSIAADAGVDAGDAGEPPLSVYDGPGCEPASGVRSLCVQNAHCAEGEVCHVDGTCLVPGTCDALGRTTLTTVGARALQSDATHVYLLYAGSEDTLGNHNGDGAILRVPLLGGAVEIVLADRTRPFDLLIDGEHLYWTEGHNGDLVLFQADKADGANVSEIMNAGHVFWAQSPTHLYFVAEETEQVFELFAMDKASGGLTVLTDEDWNTARDPVVDDDQIFLNSYDDVTTVPLTGGSPTPFGGGLGEIDCLIADEGRLYGSSYVREVLQSVSKAGGSLTNIGMLIGEIPLALDHHRDHVYLSIKDDRGSTPELRRVPLIPGELEVLATPSGMPVNRYDLPFVVNDRGLYYVQSNRVIRQVIPEYELLDPGTAQGGSGNPCHGDLGCDGVLVCRNTVCREP